MELCGSETGWSGSAFLGTGRCKKYRNASHRSVTRYEQAPQPRYRATGWNSQRLFWPDIYLRGASVATPLSTPCALVPRLRFVGFKLNGARFQNATISVHANSVKRSAQQVGTASVNPPHSSRVLKTAVDLVVLREVLFFASRVLDFVVLAGRS